MADYINMWWVEPKDNSKKTPISPSFLHQMITMVFLKITSQIPLLLLSRSIAPSTNLATNLICTKNLWTSNEGDENYLSLFCKKKRITEKYLKILLRKEHKYGYKHTEPRKTSGLK